jgi:hypothetical protein
VIDGVEERTNVCVDHPGHSPVESHRECIQGSVLRPARPEAVRKPEEFLFVDGFEEHPRRLLDDLVLERRDAERTCSPIAFRDVHTPHRQRMIAATLNAALEIEQSGFEVVAVTAPCLPIDSRCCILAQA